MENAARSDATSLRSCSSCDSRCASSFFPESVPLLPFWRDGIPDPSPGPALVSRRFSSLAEIRVDFRIALPVVAWPVQQTGGHFLIAMLVARLFCALKLSHYRPIPMTAILKFDASRSSWEARYRLERISVWLTIVGP